MSPSSRSSPACWTRVFPRMRWGSSDAVEREVADDVIGAFGGLIERE